jgi:S-adenosylmethionine hydrolase
MPGLVPIPTVEKHDSYGEGLRCEVTWVDGYGNCQLNVGPDEIAQFGKTVRLVMGDDVRSARITSHFAEIDGGAIGAVVDSYGMVALAVDRGSAAETLRLSAGDAVLVFTGSGDGQTSAVSIRPAK